MKSVHYSDKISESDSSDKCSVHLYSSHAKLIKPSVRHTSSPKSGCLRHRPTKTACTRIAEHYCIIIKPKLTKSNSCSDLTAQQSDLLLDFVKAKESVQFASPASAGDSAAPRCPLPGHHPQDMSFSRSLNKPKMPKKKSEDAALPTYASNFANNFIQQSETIPFQSTTAGFMENPRMDDADQARKLAFPFKQTPSGNFKVQSNQVVFQSPTVGVLLADPTNAKVKVKFEASTSGDADVIPNADSGVRGPELIYGGRDRGPFAAERADLKTRTSPAREDKATDLSSLGYTMREPVDWSRVQLPKKADLYQEFYRRVHNYIHTDIVVKIGEDELPCHLMVLRIYSSYFDKISDRTVELPATNVTPQAFQTIYEWMILCGSDSQKTLRRDNILDLFCAAQFLQIKDLEEQCWSFIMNEDLFTEDTAFALFQEARQRGITPVMELMVPRVMRFFLPLVASNDFLKLSLDEVLVFLGSNYICVTSEMEVLMAGVRWLRAEWATRRRYAADVMRCVRFGLVSPWQLVDVRRNRDNPELLELAQEPEVQRMLDDGLAYVIIKYWYGNGTKNYYHWTEALGLVEPAERNWIGEEKNHASYKDFLKHLEQFLVPRDQAYQLLAMQQTPRRNDDLPAGMRGVDAEKMEMRRPKIDFPLPASLKGLADHKGFPTMSEFFDSRKPAQELSPTRAGPSELPPLQQLLRPPMLNDSARLRPDTQSTQYHMQQAQELSPTRAGPSELPPLQQLLRPPTLNDSARLRPDTQSTQYHMQQAHEGSPPRAGPSELPPLQQLLRPPTLDESARLRPETQSTQYHMQQVLEQRAKCLQEQVELERQIEQQKQHLQQLQQQQMQLQKASIDDTQESEVMSDRHSISAYQPAEREVTIESHRQTFESDASSDTTMAGTSAIITGTPDHRRHSVAATYLAAATAALSTVSRTTPGERAATPTTSRRASGGSDAYGGRDRADGEQHSMFNESKEILAKANMNKLSRSVLGPPNKNYTAEGSLFSWERETVLVFGGVDPHTAYGLGTNTGRDIHRFDPVGNVWEYVGDLPVPRHHHAVAFLRGRVYLVGGADPRDDDAHGKSVVVSTVWSYDPATRAWYSEGGLTVPRKNFGLVAHRMALYAIGGQDKKGRVLRSVERLDTRSGTWSEVRGLGVARMGVACTKYREYIWVAGGMTGDRRKPLSRIVECYNSSTNEWTEINNLRFPRCFATLFSMNDKLYIIGGAARHCEKEKSTSSVGVMDVWDWKDREWKQQTEMSIPRHGHALAYLGTQLLVIGGVTTIYMRALNNVESYCCERGSWIRGVGALPSPLSGHGAVTLPPANLM